MLGGQMIDVGLVQLSLELLPAAVILAGNLVIAPSASQQLVSVPKMDVVRCHVFGEKLACHHHLAFLALFLFTG